MSVLRVLSVCTITALVLSSLLTVRGDDVWSSEVISIKSPPTIRSQFNYRSDPGRIYETPALFGMPNYLTVDTGVLVYGTPGNRAGCLPIDPTANPYWNRFLPAFDSPAPQRMVVLLDRGGCMFVTKVRNVQNANALRGSAVSVIIADNIVETDGILPYMSDDRLASQNGVTLSSLMISKSDGDILKTYLLDQESTNSSSIYVQLQYNVPRPDGRVEYDFWTTSADTASVGFKTTFGEAARALGISAVLTPHLFTVNGSLPIYTPQGGPFHCTDGDGTGCGNQCTNHGRYCGADPNQNIATGLSGQDSVRENLRQICLWRAIQPSLDVVTNLPPVDPVTNLPMVPEVLNQPLAWFTYVERLATQCSDDAWAVPTGDCSFQVMDSLGIPGLKERVQNCYLPLASVDGTNQTNPILEAEIAKQDKSGVFNLPQALVNNRPYFGSLACPSPIQPSTCGLLAMICKGFKEDTQPLYCQGPTTEQTNTSSGSSVGAVIGIVIAFGVVAGIAVYVYMKRQNMAMRDDIDSLLKQYLPLEGGVGRGSNGSHGGSSTRGNGGSIGMVNQGVTPGKKRGHGQDAHGLMSQTQEDEESQL